MKLLRGIFMVSHVAVSVLTVSADENGLNRNGPTTVRSQEARRPAAGAPSNTVLRRTPAETDAVYTDALWIQSTVPVLHFQDTDATDPASYAGLLSFKNAAGTEIGWIGDGSPTGAFLGFYGNTDYGLRFYAGGTERIAVESTGQVAISGEVTIGSSSATKNLRVYGSIQGDRVIGAVYQDIAEWVPSSQDIAPGSVVVLDPRKNNHVVVSAQAYDSRIAGVVSHQPGVLLGIEGVGKEMVATTGRVRVLVDATKHPIGIGDLLVSGEKPGVAMKSIPFEINGRRFHQPGTILGKALEPLASGVGEILVLLSLQ